METNKKGITSVGKKNAKRYRSYFIRHNPNIDIDEESD